MSAYELLRSVFVGKMIAVWTIVNAAQWREEESGNFLHFIPEHQRIGTRASEPLSAIRQSIF